MKRIFTIITIAVITLIVFSSEAIAQHEYRPLLKEKKRWNYELEHVNVWEGTNTTENVSFFIEGDIAIEGKAYKKMYYASSDEHFSSLENCMFYRALREEGRQVYMYDEYLGDILLFDFGMQPGENYEIGEFSCLELTSLQQMTFHGRELTVMLYTLYDASNPESTPNIVISESIPIVESVGSNNGWDILEEYTPIPTNGIYDSKHFKSCYEGDECIFTSADFLQTTSFRPMILHHATNDGKFYDLKGHQFSTPPNKGIYIRNGRKYVGK